MTEDGVGTRCDVVIPCRDEAAAITGRQDPEQALTALLESVPEVLLTLGGEGSLHGLRVQSRCVFPPGG